MTTLRRAKVRDSAFDAAAIARIKYADNAIHTARANFDSDAALSAAHDELSRAALAAHDLGVSWQTIGEALGIARGTAYKRFRRRPATNDSANLTLTRG